MTNLLPTLRFALLAAASSLLFTTASCSKKEEPAPAPAPTTGGIEGTISPATAVTTVTATNTGNVTFLQTPAASGAFTFANLLPGSYTLTCTPKAGFLAPDVRYVTVVAGQVAPAGTIAVAAEPLGSLAGVIDPVDAVTRVELVSGTGTVTPAVPNAATGTFRFENLGLGTYTVRFVVAPGFYPVSDITGVQLSSRNPDVNLYPINVQSDGTPRGTVSWTANGVAYTSTSLNRGPTSSGDFGILANSLSSTTGTNEELVLRVSYAVFNGIGTYPLGVSYYAVAQYTRAFSSGSTLRYFTPGNGATVTGNIVVTGYTSSPRTAVGTFAFVATGQNGGSNPPLTVTNGSFNLRF